MARYVLNNDQPGCLAFQHNNDGEDAVTRCVLPPSPPLSPSAMPWKNKLHNAFEQQQQQSADCTIHLINLDLVKVPMKKKKPVLQRSATVPESSSDHLLWDKAHAQAVVAKEQKKVTIVEQSKSSSPINSEVKLRLAEMLGKQ